MLNNSEVLVKVHVLFLSHCWPISEKMFQITGGRVSILTVLRSLLEFPLLSCGDLAKIFSALRGATSLLPYCIFTIASSS